MSSAFDPEWRPSWPEQEIVTTPPKIKEVLRAGPWKSQIESATQRSQGSTWWSRQFDITQRAAHAELETSDRRIAALADDAPRVLRRVKTEWDHYFRRVRMQRGDAQRKRLLSTAMKGSVEFYVFLVTDHIAVAWQTHRPGMEASSLSAWEKIGYDNQFLWSLREFDAAFLVGAL